MDPSLIPKFISDWQKSGAAERANYALFLTELCDLLGTATTPAAIAAAFKGARADRVEDLLETLASLGQARTLPDGTFVAQ